jgi:hypothetical protein
VEGYKRYIKGVYYQDSKLMETLDKKGRQSTFEALRKGYPHGWSYQKLADTYKLKSTYPNCEALHDKNIVKREEVQGSRSRDVKKYYFEDYNYINNKKERFRFPFAPGYVQYTDDFLNNYQTLNGKFKFEIYQIYSSLINILKHAVNNEKQTPTRQCKFCGYDHEMRDFIRATLLHLIDGIEEHDQFINEILLNEGIVTVAAYEQLKTELERTPSKVNEQNETAQKDLMKKQQIIHSMENEEQTARHATPHKQYKRKPHTEERKRHMSLQMRGYRHIQEDIEKMRRYQFNDYAFDKLNADAKYWIGYIMARGSIVIRSDSPNIPSIKISVPEEDLNHLDRFKEFIKSDHPVRHHEKKHIYELEFRSSRICHELERYGIHSNMRYHERVIILEHDKDFWRGFIDGNGSGRSGRFEISRYGKIFLRIKKGHELIQQFKTFAENILGHSIGEPILKIKNWSLTITDENAAELYLKLLYDKNSIALDGNLKRIEQILSLPEYKTKTWVRKYFTHT